MRLCLFVAKFSQLSRRQAGEYVKKGKVKVDGKIITNPAYQLKAQEKVELEGKLLRPQKKIYLAFNKPKGVTSVFKDKFAVRKLSDFIPRRFGRLYPVGRLDKESRGLLLLTNDGQFCFQISHPKFQVEKEYRVKINAFFTQAMARKITQGLEDEGEILRAKKVRLVKKGDNFSVVSLILTQGKKREIRRLFKALGVKVLDLQRVRIGKVKLKDLAEGKYRFLKKAELEIK